MIKNLFNNFLRNFMIGIFIFSIISSGLINVALNFIIYDKFSLDMKFIVNTLAILIILFALSVAYYKRDKIIIWLQKLLDVKNLMFFIMLVSFSIRILWITLTKTVPVSDFAIMYNSAKEVFSGNLSCFHGVNYTLIYEMCNDCVNGLTRKMLNSFIFSWRINLT